MCSLMGTLAGAGAPTGGIAPADADAGGRRAGCRRLDLGDDAADPAEGTCTTRNNTHATTPFH